MRSRSEVCKLSIVGRPSHCSYLTHSVVVTKPSEIDQCKDEPGAIHGDDTYIGSVIIRKVAATKSPEGPNILERLSHCGYPDCTTQQINKYKYNI